MSDSFMNQTSMLVISGGQTGVDLAGLRAAQIMGFRTGGTAPLKWRTQNGPQPALAQFGLRQSTVANYAERTEVNVVTANATLMLYADGDSAGTKLTRKLCKIHDRATYEIDLKAPVNIGVAEQWIRVQGINSAALSGGFVLNIAGNSSSTAPGIFQPAFGILLKLFNQLASGPTAEDDVHRADLYNKLLEPQNVAQLIDRFDYIPQLDFRNRHNGLIIDGATHVSG